MKKVWFKIPLSRFVQTPKKLSLSTVEPLLSIWEEVGGVE